MSTKLHVAVDVQGRPVELSLTPGQEHDIQQAASLLADYEPDDVIADKAYDCDEFVQQITGSWESRSDPVPHWSNRLTPPVAGGGNIGVTIKPSDL